MTNSEDADKIVDLSFVLEMVGRNPELLRQVVASFWESADELVEGIRAALTEGNAGALQRAAHALKGAAANFRAGPVVAAAVQLEELARAGDLASAAAELGRLEAELARLRPALAALTE